MAQSEATKKLIAESMKKLLRQTPMSRITVDDICEESHFSRRSFYRHFLDKYDLLTWIYNEEFCKKQDVRPDKTIWDYYPDIVRHLYEDRAFYRNAFDFYGQNSFRKFCVSKLYPLIMNDFGDVFPSTEVARFVVDRYTNAAFDGFRWWLSQEPCMPPDEYAKFSMDIIFATAKGIMKSFKALPLE